MNAQMQTIEATFERMTEATLDAVLAVEHTVYPHPWQRQHFADCLASGYQAYMLTADSHLLGYFVVMKGYEEAHLLNLAVAPPYQRQGWAQVMLDAVQLWARGQGAQWLWLEARASNTRAIHVYKTHGFHCVGERKNYYPAEGGRREHAVVMNLKL